MGSQITVFPPGDPALDRHRPHLLDNWTRNAQSNDSTASKAWTSKIAITRWSSRRTWLYVLLERDTV